MTRNRIPMYAPGPDSITHKHLRDNYLLNTGFNTNIISQYCEEAFQYIWKGYRCLSSSSYPAGLVSKTAQPPFIMIMLLGGDKTLLARLHLDAMHPRDAKSNLPTCEIHILPRGKTEEERKQACRDRRGFCLTERSTLGR